MAEYVGVPATSPEFDLAEGVLWDDLAGLVRWVDIPTGRVLAGELDGRRITNLQARTIDGTAAAVALADDGGLLVAASRALATISPAGRVAYGPDLLGRRAGVRLNDGSVDPFGAFVVGTMSLAGRTDEETLLRVSPDGTVETLRSRIGLSNGVAFAPDSSTIYHVDTFARTIAAHSYGPGPFVGKEPWRTIATLPYSPDGLTVDASGALWVAAWGGARVNRYSPTGALLDTVEVDAAFVSCPGFVGERRDLLAVTTARPGLDTEGDQAGAIFLADVDAVGLPSLRWSGSTTKPSWT